MKCMQPTQSHFIATVYSPPGPYTAFLTEFPEFLSDLVVMADNITFLLTLIFTWKSPQTHSKSLSEPSCWVLSSSEASFQKIGTEMAPHQT